jgi:hypothetical protein
MPIKSSHQQIDDDGGAFCPSTQEAAAALDEHQEE